jgi:hypothetical protein
MKRQLLQFGEVLAIESRASSIISGRNAQPASCWLILPARLWQHVGASRVQCIVKIDFGVVEGRAASRLPLLRDGHDGA